MPEQPEPVEMEYSEDDILYYLVDEEGNEVGFVIEEDGEEVECYYEGFDSSMFEVVDDAVSEQSPITAVESTEAVEIEYSEEDVLYYLEDEEGTEVGFVIEEDGEEIECYYEGFESSMFEEAEELSAEARTAEPYVPEKATEHGYLHKIASIAGHEGNKARKKAEGKLDKVRGKAEVHVDKAKKTATEQATKAKAKADEMDLGITREGVAEATSDLNAIAKEGAETAKELKEAYDDIMDSFGFLVPKKVRRRLP